jgi:prephenate dehydratase
MTPKTAIYGEQGSFAAEAARTFFETEIVFCPTLADLRKAIDEQIADFAVLPVENSLVGAVQINQNFLRLVGWRTISHLDLHIRQNLIGAAAATLETISQIESHPTALAQCQRFLASRKNWRQIATDNTAASAKNVIESGDATRAAIASAQTARIFGGQILVADIHDQTNNFTKFLLLKKR